MTAFSISGLASGIDTASLITQLMAVAAQPQTQLKTKVTNENNVIAAYQSINTKVAAVQTAAQALQSASTWTAATASSSNSSVVASADTTATAGSSTTFSVAKLAMAQTSTFTTTGSGVVLSGTPPTFTINPAGGSPLSITAASGSATDVAAAINAAGAGVRASVVNTDGGQVLQLTSTGTGTGNAFTVSGLDSPQKDIIAAQNAQITVGDPAAGGYTVSSQTNTFSNVIPGVTFTVSAPTTSPVTISTSQDTSGVSGKVQALVDAVNSAFAEIGTDTAQGGLLNGDSTVTRLQQSLLSQVAQGFSGGSYSSYGVSLTSAGKLTFDSSAFATAYNANPSATQAAIGTALGGAYNTISTQASDPTSGTLTTAINADQGVVSDLNSQISDWTTRLADMQASLQAKYAAMEAAVSKLQSESTWLASALGTTSSTSSTSSSSSSS